MKPFFIDVRTKQEWKSGHVDDAIHLSLEDLMTGKDPKLPKSSKIYLYCRSGNRSAMAKHVLEQRGYTNLHNAGSLEDARILSITQQ